MLVLYYLNIDNDIEDQLYTIFRFIADKENGFVTFFIKTKILNNMIQDVFDQGGDPPANKLRKVVFKPYSGLDLSGKLKIVGQLIGRSSNIDDEAIYQCMLDLNDMNKKITWSRVSGLLDCSTRTIYRNLNKQLKKSVKAHGKQAKQLQKDIQDEVEIDEAFTLADYKELESDNQHAEAAAKLVNQYGTSDEKKEIAAINARHMKTGYISGPDFRRRVQISNKYYSRLK